MNSFLEYFLVGDFIQGIEGPGVVSAGVGVQPEDGWFYWFEAEGGFIISDGAFEAS